MNRQRGIGVDWTSSSNLIICIVSGLFLSCLSSVIILLSIFLSFKFISTDNEGVARATAISACCIALFLFLMLVFQYTRKNKSKVDFFYFKKDSSSIIDKLAIFSWIVVIGAASALLTGFGKANFNLHYSLAGLETVMPLIIGVFSASILLAVLRSRKS